MDEYQIMLRVSVPWRHSGRRGIMPQTFSQARRACMNGRILNRNDEIKRHDEGGELVEVIEVLEQAVNGASWRF